MALAGEEVLRVQASIHAWPNFFGSRVVQFPPTYGQLKRVWGSSELRGTALCIIVDIPTVRLARLPKSGLPGVYEVPTELRRATTRTEPTVSAGRLIKDDVHSAIIGFALKSSSS